MLLCRAFATDGHHYLRILLFFRRPDAFSVLMWELVRPRATAGRLLLSSSGLGMAGYEDPGANAKQ